MSVSIDPLWNEVMRWVNTSYGEAKKSGLTNLKYEMSCQRQSRSTGISM